MLPAASDVLPVETEREVIRLALKPGAAQRSKASAVITRASLRRLVCPPGQSEAFYWDDQVPGLGLRAYASGKRVWLLQYRDATGRTRRIGLGDASVLAPDGAREAARMQLTQKAIGNDPAAKRQADREAACIGDLVTAYLAHQQQRSKPSTFDQTRRNLNKYAATLHKEVAAAVDRAAIFQLHNRLTASTGAVQANRTLATLSAMFSWAMRAGLAKQNPAMLVPRNRETAKDRVLSDDELGAIWKATRFGSDYDRIVRLLMLTGCRRDEIGALRWSEISGTLLTVPEVRTKTAIAHEVPLSALAMAQLPMPREGRGPLFGQGSEGFSGWSRSKARLDRRIAHLRRAEAGLADCECDTELSVCTLPAWGLHDFRRTLSTRLNEAGVEPHVVEALLGHAGAKRGVAGVYNKASYRTQKTAALERWGSMIADIIGAA